MTFAHPGWLWSIPVILGALIAVWLAHDARQRRALERFVAPHLAGALTRSVSHRRRGAQRALFALAIVLLCAALAEPRAGFRLETVRQRGTEILFAVDTSRSMLTPDMRPDRLTRAKLAIDDLLGDLDGDAVGLIAFAGSAFLQCPITQDYGAFAESVAALDTHVIPHGGTDIGSAIREASAAFRGRPDADKVLVLLTDGEDLAGEALEAAKAAGREHVRIYTVGVGTRGGDLIPLPPETGGGFLKDRDGHLVASRLDEAALQAIAAATGGRYVSLVADSGALEALYRDVLAPRAKHELEARTERIYRERFQGPLGAAVLALLASVLVSTRRTLPQPAAEPAGAASLEPAAPAALGRGRVAGASLMLLAAVALAAAPPAHAADAPAATQHYNEGIAAYRARDYAHAVEEFRASLATQPSGDARRLAEQEDTYYNLGNGLYRLGQQTAAQDPKRTREAWHQALAAYDAALELKPQDADGRFNRDFVKHKLEDLERVQPPHAASQPSASASSSSQRSGQDPSRGEAGAGADDPRSGSAGQTSQPPSSGAASSLAAANSGEPASQGQGARSSPAPSSAHPPAQGRVAAAAQPSSPSSASGAATASAERAPGAMSADEARELLDSARDEERRLPAAPSARNEGTAPPADEPTRDW